MSSLVHVDLGDRSYDIHIGAGLLADVEHHLADLAWTRAVLITDEHVVKYYGWLLERLQVVGQVSLVKLEPGEATKSVANAEHLWEELLRVGADRKTLILALGGGVIGDLAGFVAATFARGLPFVQIPTTLLAQVDSSVGGKVAVNLPNAKNMVGAFWQPKTVLIDVTTLETLPLREYRAGLAEVVKYGVILDEDFFAYLETHVDELNHLDPDVLRHVVARSCELKADVVRQDETETLGLRAVLNYGHTFAHAFEAVGGYGELLHGEAVSIGMVCASRLAERMGRISSDVTDRQIQLLKRLSLPVDPPNLDRIMLLEAMQRDKKMEHGTLHFVLPTKLGRVERVAGAPAEHVRAVLGRPAD